MERYALIPKGLTRIWDKLGERILVAISSPDGEGILPDRILRILMNWERKSSFQNDPILLSLTGSSKLMETFQTGVNLD
jgi:hypothetical protein